MKFSWKKNHPILCSAPMHGITNSAQRQIFKKYGSHVVFSEMVSSMGLKYNNQKTINKTRFSKKEKPIVIQVFGNSTEETVQAAKQAEKMGADGIDFNCGCPARNMLASGNGGKLLLETAKLIDILAAIKANIKIPLSLKTRIGFDQKLPPSFYKQISQKSNIDCLIIHGRTVKQKYQGKADWDQIKKISQNINIPVIGSGDITSPQIAIERITNYSPAGIMIGRGALGNPWIFQQINQLLNKKQIRPRFSIKKITKLMIFHSQTLVKELNNEKQAIMQMRKHYGWYIKNFPHAKQYRIRLFQSTSLPEVEKILKEMESHY